MDQKSRERTKLILHYYIYYRFVETPLSMERGEGVVIIRNHIGRMLYVLLKYYYFRISTRGRTFVKRSDELDSQ